MTVSPNQGLFGFKLPLRVGHPLFSVQVIEVEQEKRLNDGNNMITLLQLHFKLEANHMLAGISVCVFFYLGFCSYSQFGEWAQSLLVILYDFNPMAKPHLSVFDW